MLDIKPLEEHQIPQVKKLEVAGPQLPFVGRVSSIISVAPDTSHFHVFWVGNQMVGFCNIDIAYAQHYPFTNPGELGLRAFFIDYKMQGKGYGKTAIQVLRNYLREKYTAYPSICLTVNCKNPAAYHCYEKGGFYDTGELYHGGKAGPQHIMRMKIEDPA